MSVGPRADADGAVTFGAPAPKLLLDRIGQAEGVGEVVGAGFRSAMPWLVGGKALGGLGHVFLSLARTLWRILATSLASAEVSARLSARSPGDVVFIVMLRLKVSCEPFAQTTSSTGDRRAPIRRPGTPLPDTVTERHVRNPPRRVVVSGASTRTHSAPEPSIVQFVDSSSGKHIRQRTREVLEQVIPSDRGAALLDFPNHANAGDALIYLGELAYLAEMKCDVRYSCVYNTYDKSVMDDNAPDSPILLHGGGNFGDRYKTYQQFRERVITENTTRKIVQMPQTFEFADTEFLTNTRRIYARHPDLTILIRHRSDLDRILDLFPDNRVLFCPDAAFGVGHLQPTGPADHELVIVKRIDGESADGTDELPPGVVRDAYVDDWRPMWLSTARHWFPRSLLIVALSTRPAFRRRIAGFSQRSFERQARIIVDQAVNTLSRGHVVVTDRLHAGILGILMGKPVVLVDNANRKLSRAHRDYLADLGLVEIADDFPTAIGVAQTMRK